MTVLAHLDTTSADFFEQKYRAAADPWNFALSAYEQARYDATLAALAGRRHHRGFEPGCSVGVLTERLALQCDSLLSADIAESAAGRARERCRHLPNVEVRCAPLTAALMPAHCDLLVLSEIGYYFDTPDWATLASSLADRLSPGGTLLAIHWLGHSPDHVTSGDEVHAALGQLTSLHLEYADRCEQAAPDCGYRLERYLRI